MVRVFDKYGYLIRSFRTWSEANKFRIIMGRFDWSIK